MKILAAAPSERRSHTARNALVVIVVIAIAAAAFLFLTQGSVVSPIRPSSVTVTGTVSTKGLGTSPTNIGFTSDNGQIVNAAVVSGKYSLTLPNDHTYTVKVQWSGALGATGTCTAGTLPVSQGPGGSALTNNWSC